eukprot:RCo019527
MDYQLLKTMSASRAAGSPGATAAGESRFPAPAHVVGWTGFIPGAQSAVGMSFHRIERAAAEQALEESVRRGPRPPPAPEYPTEADVPEPRYVQRPLYDRLGRTSNTTTFKLE